MSHTTYPHINSLTREYITTDEAAFYLNRRPQTLRVWAMTGDVVAPIRIHGRLAWPVAEIKKIIGGSL